jgi:hypothetical protein
MPKELFAKRIEPHLKRHGVMYISQTNHDWDLRGLCTFNDNMVWVTKVRGRGVVFIGLLEEDISLQEDEIYVVMWNRRFMPQWLLRTARSFDLDTILLRIIGGVEKPKCWYPVRIMTEMIFHDSF